MPVTPATSMTAYSSGQVGGISKCAFRATLSDDETLNASPHGDDSRLLDREYLTGGHASRATRVRCVPLTPAGHMLFRTA